MKKAKNRLLTRALRIASACLQVFTEPISSLLTMAAGVYYANRWTSDADSYARANGS